MTAPEGIGNQCLMPTFVLIHGSQHARWCWRKIEPLLERKGHTVAAPDLPGHGDDQRPPSEVTLKSYADRICAAASAQNEPVILVGHSGGDAAITQAAENCPDKIRALVYLSAFLPRNGESVMTWVMQDHESVIHGRVLPVAEGLVSVPRELFHEAFYGKCSAEDEAFATPLLMPQASAPLETPVTTSTERWGRIPRYYIECACDRTITLRLQRAMQRPSPCQEVFSLDADHSPFFSAPRALVDILDRLAPVQAATALAPRRG